MWNIIYIRGITSSTKDFLDENMSQNVGNRMFCIFFPNLGSTFMTYIFEILKVISNGDYSKGGRTNNLFSG